MYFGNRVSIWTWRRQYIIIIINYNTKGNNLWFDWYNSCNVIVIYTNLYKFFVKIASVEACKKYGFYKIKQ